MLSAATALALLVSAVPDARAKETVCGSRKGIQILRDSAYTKRGGIEIPFTFFNPTDYIASAWCYVEITDGDGEIIVTEERLVENINSRKRESFALAIPADKATATRKIECDLWDVEFRVDTVRQGFNTLKDDIGFEVEITEDVVDLRPQMNSIGSLESIPRGTRLTVTGKDLWQDIRGPDHAEWYKVSFGDKTGWISEKTCRRLNGEK